MYVNRRFNNMYRYVILFMYCIGCYVVFIQSIDEQIYMQFIVYLICMGFE